MTGPSVPEGVQGHNHFPTPAGHTVEGYKVQIWRCDGGSQREFTLWTGDKQAPQRCSMQDVFVGEEDLVLSFSWAVPSWALGGTSSQ